MDTTSIQTGGKMLGEGAYGCVFAGPALKCKGDSIAKLPKNTQVKDGMPLTKITIKSEADDEFAIAKQIQKIPLWKNYFLVAESMCEPAPKQEQIQDCDIIKGKELNKYRVLTSSYGGVPIVSYKLNFYKNSFEDMFKHLLEAGALLALFGVVHWDLHLGNILVDSVAVPRIIDFNLAKNMREKAIPNELSIKFRFDLFQLPPDSSLVVGVYKGIDPYVAIEQIIKGKDILKKINSVLGIEFNDMERDLEEFYKTSRAMQDGDPETWFKYYWPKIDSWAIGAGATFLLSRYLLWPAFSSGQYRDYSDKLLKVLRGLCQVDPRKRLDCVQALAMIDPTNYIVVKYGKRWLESTAT